MIRRPPRSTQSRSSAASDVYKRQGYRPQFYVRTTDVTGAIKLPEGVEMVMPGDNIEMTVELIQPIAMEEGVHFAIREGGRTVGSGKVTKILKLSLIHI